PNIKQPRVLWIGVEETHQQLILLKSNIDKGLEPLGFEIDRKKFSPHLTLGRIKSAKGKSRLREMIQSFEKMDAEAIKVSSVKLMQSQLTPRGSIYTVLQAFKFQ
ncbi:MAG: RNA 2',3'-cyclic phosphodiesterase, partial [Nitrospinales bacterium]